jgi:hypothetical protein
LSDIHDSLDSLVVESCPKAAARWPSSELPALASAVLDQFPGLRAFSRVLPTGSFLHETAIEVNSGVDLLVVRDVGHGGQLLEPSGLIEDVASALGSNRPPYNKHGFLVDDAKLGRRCFIPAIAQPDGTAVRVVDFKEARWHHSCPVTHAGALRSFDDLGRCMVRFVKTWNNDQVVPLESFHVEAIAIAASMTTEAWNERHIHWKIKTFFDIAKERASERCGHPLDPEVLLDYLASDAQAQVMRQLEQASNAANNAWFLMEFDPDMQSAVAWYARLLDPSLGA